MSKNYYITTPIYYVNDVPHIGNAYTTIIADCFSRYTRLMGTPCHFLTGTDEHATKVAAVAQQKGIPTKEFVDGLSEAFQQVWKNLDIEYDDFIRTTEPRHKDVVRAIFSQLLDQGDIYKGVYKGWYCSPCETFFLESELVDGCCPNPECRRPVQLVEEENYYFRLSAYGDRLLAYIKDHPDFLLPESRKNEVVGFIKQGLKDVSITRKNTGWGITVPGDDNMVIYVWFDALINYISAAGYLADPDKFTSLWPADLQLMGKDIFVRFHSTFWPALLMALNLELPKHIIGHGFWTINGEKISKSKGNAVSPAQMAEELSEKSGASIEVCRDAVRYYLARETTFGVDGDFSFDTFYGRYNSDLANDLGNLLNRSLGMLTSYNEGRLPAPVPGALRIAITDAQAEYVRGMEAFAPNQALDAVWDLINAGNKYIQDSMPWQLNKEGRREELDLVLFSALEVIRAAAIMVSPFMPNTAREILKQLGIGSREFKWEDVISPDPFAGAEGIAARPIFPRMGGKGDKKQQAAPKKEEPKQPAEPAGSDDTISIEDFAKLDLRVGRITAAEKVEGADKLYKLTVDLGSETRTICAGMAPYYEADYMVGKEIVVIANLKPRKIRGILSHGMMLAGEDANGVKFLSPEGQLEPGSKIR
ncbi:MAG: methionine--tRNA ligase [Abditibacteriota bacterium]|nr:methionine--tRNA ligase [Abditibacteriota bacterium]